MIKQIPQVEKGHYYSKQDTAKLLQISRHTLRKYTQLNHIRTILHPISGREVYSGDDILATWSRGLQTPPPKTYSSVGRFDLNSDIAASQNFRSKLNAFKARINTKKL